MTQALADIDTEVAEAFVEKLFSSAVGAADTMVIYVGDKLGCYRALDDRGPLTPGELADACGIHPRYAREWCEHQTTTGVLVVDDATAEPEERRYALPAEHAAALTDPDSPFSIAPLHRLFAAVGAKLPELLDAYRTGGGVAWEAFGDDAIESQGDFNRPWLRTDLVQSYLPSISDVHEKLTSGARVVDVACGVGWAGISIAKAYPRTTVVGLDPDDSSIALARRFAAEDGVADRTSFEVHNADDPLASGPFDVAIMVEALHDVAHPIEILSRIREALTPGGTLLVVDEKTGASFAEPGENDGLFYGFSLLCCLPAGMSEEASAATGTVIRPSTVTEYATAAGFSTVEVLEQIEHPMFHFYRIA